MALQHLRSSTANKRPTPAAMSDGQLAVNTEATSPGLFFKNASGDLVKVGPVHVGTTAPNASPASGGQTGNTLGEQWLDTTGGGYVFKVWDGSAWRSEAGEFVNTSGDTMTGALVMDNQQQIRFRETTANGTNYVALQAPASVASDKTITLPDVTGTVVTTGDTGTVTSTMITDGTIVDGDINASAAIADTKLAQITTASKVSGTALTGTIPSAVLGNSTAYVGTTAVALNRSSANQALTGISSVALPGATSGTVTVTPASVAGTTAITIPATSGTLVTTGDTGSVTSTMILDGTIVNADVNASAAIAGTKISPDFGSQNRTSTGTSTAASFIPSSSTAPTNGVYLPAANSVGIATNSTARLFVNSTGNVGVGTTSATSVSNLLHLRSDSSSNVDHIFIQNRTGGANSGARIAFGNGVNDYADNRYAYIGAINTGASENGNHLVFAPNANGAGATERARIDSSGRLLVGTSTQQGSHLFQVEGDSDGTSGAGSIFLRRGLSNATIESSGDVILAQIDFGSKDGGGSAARVSSFRDGGTWSATSKPGRLIFSTTANGASSPTERLRITSDGKVGIGTTSPASGISVLNYGTQPLSGANTYPYPAGRYHATLGQVASGTNVWAAFVGEYANATGSCNILLQPTYQDVNQQAGAYIAGEATGAAATAITFGHVVGAATTSGNATKTERARITSGGEVYIAGTTDQGAYNLQVNGTGVWGAGAYVNGSDERLKEDIKPLASATDVLMQLRPVTFKYKESYSRDQSIQPGFIAQELQEAMAGQVYLDGVVQQGPEYLNVAYQGLIPVLTKALQEALAKIDTLEARLTAAGI